MYVILCSSIETTSNWLIQQKYAMLVDDITLFNVTVLKEKC